MSLLKFKNSLESPPPNTTGADENPWTVLVVDDDHDVHSMTGFVMKGWVFEGRPINLVSAESTVRAREILAENRNIALVLLDVVMEHETSGLELVKYIREDLRDPFIRIILRTGQPGAAPVRTIINDYEINDYKEKNDLTVDKLFVAVTAALRSYRHLMTIEANRKGLEQVLHATSGLFSNQSIDNFADGVLVQISGLVDGKQDSLFLQRTDAGSFNPGDIRILAATGVYGEEGSRKADLQELDDPLITSYARRSLQDKQSFFEGNDYIGYFPVNIFTENILIFRGLKRISQFKRHLLQIFSSNASMAFRNLYLNRELEESQQEVICTLGEIVETRSKETAYHIKRVSGTCALLGRAAGMEEERVRIFELASSMHDVGKIGIPNEILHKPGRLIPEEYEAMKTHTLLGYEILKHSGSPVMKMAAMIALEHHERWDGNGYPYKKNAGETSLEGRITAIVDVFDALYNHRIYKDPWPLEKILTLFEEERGGHFDPELLDIFLANLEDITAIQKNFSDDQS